MRIKRPGQWNVFEGDLTPMIDMTFQLIAFFMLVINFSQTEEHQRIMLPDSELAKPPETEPEIWIALHMEKDGTVIFEGQPFRIEQLGPFLDREARDAAADGLQAQDVTVIIRAHRDADTGKVQQLMAKCQESQLETFALRVKEKL